MTMNQISATMTQADRDAVLAAVATIKEKLPFLIDLTSEQRKSLPKMGRQFKSEVHHPGSCPGGTHGDSLMFITTKGHPHELLPA